MPVGKWTDITEGCFVGMKAHAVFLKLVNITKEAYQEFDCISGFLPVGIRFLGGFA